MGIPDLRDPVATRDVVADWLSARLPEARDLEVGPITTPGGSGFSNETLLCDATWSDDAGAHAEGLVIRIEPRRFQVFYDVDLERQYRVMEALGRHTDVPVPRTLWFEPDADVLGAPFAVMGRVEGRVPADSPPYTTHGWVVDDLSPDERCAMWEGAVDVLARLHTLDVDAAGLGFLGDLPVNGAAAQLAHYEEYFAWAREGLVHPTLDDGFAWARDHLPPDRRTALSWGDARPGNILFAGVAPAAVLDWEMVALADPQLDLGWWLLLDRHQSDGYGVPNPEGIPSRGAQLDRWRERTGFDAPDLAWYEVFAACRFGVVMVRLGRMGKEIGMIPPDYPIETDNNVTRLLAQLLELPPPAERR